MFTNSNNINSLKVVVGGEVAGVQLQVVGVAPNGTISTIINHHTYCRTVKTPDFGTLFNFRIKLKISQGDKIFFFQR